MVEIKLTDNINIGQISSDDFIQSVSNYNIDQALNYIQWINCKLKNFVFKRVNIIRDRPPFSIGDYFLITTEANAFIAKWLISQSSEIYDKKFTTTDYAKCTLLYNHLEVDLTYYSKNNNDIYKALIRSANTQYHYMRQPGYLAGRYLLLFSDSIGSAAKKMCKEKTGLLPETIIIIGMICYGHLIRKGSLIFEEFLSENESNPNLSEIINESNLKRFLKLFSADISTLRKLNNKSHISNSMLPLFKFEYNPLWSFPIISRSLKTTNKNKLIVPSINDLVYASTEGIYYKLMDLNRGEGKKNKFSTEFGEVFRNYIFYLLRLTNITVQDLDLNPTKNISRPDFALVQSTKTFIEVKKRIMSNAIRSCQGKELEKYIKSIAADIYKQLFIPWLRSEREHECLLVSLDEWYYFEMKIKPIIESYLKEMATKTESVHLSQFRFHLLGCTQFEILIDFIQNSSNNDIGILLKEKAESHYYNNIHDFLINKYKYDSNDNTLHVMKIFDDFAKKLKA